MVCLEKPGFGFLARNGVAVLVVLLSAHLPMQLLLPPPGTWTLLSWQQGQQQAPQQRYSEPLADDMGRTMADFKQALKHTLNYEGGYVNDRIDRGGETYRGISRKHHRNWPGWTRVDELREREVSMATMLADPTLAHEVENFYASIFWRPLRLTEIESQAIANKVFDCAVNCGPARAVRWLQAACNLVGVGHVDIEVDGKLGPQTVAAANLVADKFGQQEVMVSLRGQQYAHYARLVAGDPSQSRFIRGWLKRV